MLLRLMIMTGCALFFQLAHADNTIDSSTITEITVKPHPGYRPGQATLSLTNTSTVPSDTQDEDYAYGNLADESDLQANTDGSKLNVVEGLAANPLTSSLSDYQYSEMEVVQPTFSQPPMPNN